MKDWQGQAHVKWECKYHVMLVLKYRSRKISKRVRGRIGEILRELCRQKGQRLVGRQGDAGSCAYTVERFAEIPRGHDDGLSEGQECVEDSSRTVGNERQPVRSSVLVPRILREYGGPGGSDDSPLHPEPGEDRAGTRTQTI